MAAGGVQMMAAPAWLAPALGALLAALVSGSAALLGVLLGGRAARRTAEHTASLAREDEHRRWKRERRYAAYIAFLGALDRYMDAAMPLAAMHKELQEGGSGSGQDMEALTQTIKNCEAEVQSSLPHVELAGTTESRLVAERWTAELKAFFAAAKNPEWGTLESARIDAKSHRNVLIGQMRRELEVDG